MFNSLAKKLESMFTDCGEDTLNRCLASEFGFNHFEQRTHYYEASHSPFAWVSSGSGAPREWEA